MLSTGGDAGEVRIGRDVDLARINARKSPKETVRGSKVEQEDRQSDQASRLLASIVESSEDAIVSKTLQGQILTWNRGAEKIFGFTAAEAVGQPINIIIPPDRLDEEKMILDRLRRGERIEHYETIRLSKTGEPIDISVTISPVHDANGRVIGASKIARDITARKQAEQDLERIHQMSLRLAATLDLQTILEDTLRTAAAIEGTGLGILSLFFSDAGRMSHRGQRWF